MAEKVGVDEAGIYSFWLGGLCLYIGRSKHVRRRIRQHLMGQHSNPRLQRALGETAAGMKWRVLEWCPPNGAYLRAAESVWQEKLKPACNVVGKRRRAAQKWPVLTPQEWRDKFGGFREMFPGRAALTAGE